jgi:hypothetical protein
MTDAKDLIKKCKGCQFFAKQQHLLTQVLRTIPPSCPFTMLGLDSVGPFRTARGGYRYILVAVDKFTKWIEVQPLTKVMSEEAMKFMQEITHRFVCPTESSLTWGRPSQGLPFGTSTKIT